MKLKLFSAFFIVLGCVFIFANCRQPSSNEAKNGINVTDAEGKIVSIADASRIVSIGTAVTETIYALGAGERLVGVDNSSAEYIPETKNLPKVGPRTTLSAEGILSLKPTLVILNADAGPPQAIEQLRGAGLTVLSLTPNYTVETVKAKVQTIAKALNLEAKGAEINNSIDAEMREAAKTLEAKQATPKVMFAGRGPNAPNATMSGTGTTVDEMIRLAGGTNPLNDFTGFRPMTDEAVVAAQPDIILITDGLIVPHLLRLIIGPDHRNLLPGSALLGACLLLSADLTARTLVAPAEMPIGVLTAITGAPFFLWLLLRDRKWRIIH